MSDIFSYESHGQGYHQSDSDVNIPLPEKPFPEVPALPRLRLEGLGGGSPPHCQKCLGNAHPLWFGPGELPTVPHLTSARGASREPQPHPSGWTSDLCLPRPGNGVC